MSEKFPIGFIQNPEEARIVADGEKPLRDAARARQQLGPKKGEYLVDTKTRKGMDRAADKAGEQTLELHKKKEAVHNAEREQPENLQSIISSEKDAASMGEEIRGAYERCREMETDLSIYDSWAEVKGYAQNPRLAEKELDDEKIIYGRQRLNSQYLEALKQLNILVVRQRVDLPLVRKDESPKNIESAVEIPWEQDFEYVLKTDSELVRMAEEERKLSRTITQFEKMEADMDEVLRKRYPRESARPPRKPSDLTAYPKEFARLFIASTRAHEKKGRMDDEKRGTEQGILVRRAQVYSGRDKLSGASDGELAAMMRAYESKLPKKERASNRVYLDFVAETLSRTADRENRVRKAITFFENGLLNNFPNNERAKMEEALEHAISGAEATAQYRTKVAGRITKAEYEDAVARLDKLKKIQIALRTMGGRM